jgi:methionine biosynthesis protein MetW
MFEVGLQDYDFRIDPSNANSPITKFIQMIPRGSRVLEVGCANGALSAYLTRELACEVVGIELNPEAAYQAERHCSRVIIADVEKDALDRAEGRFDVITFGDLLEHLVSPGTVLSRCRHLLSSTGFVLISVPNVAHYTVRLRLLRGQFDYEHHGLIDHTHLRFFTLRTARQMLADSGYQISAFDIAYAMRGARLVRRCRPLESFLKRHLTGLIGCGFIFKAVPDSERLDDARRSVQPGDRPEPGSA